MGCTDEPGYGVCNGHGACRPYPNLPSADYCECDDGWEPNADFTLRDPSASDSTSIALLPSDCTIHTHSLYVIHSVTLAVAITCWAIGVVLFVRHMPRAYAKHLATARAKSASAPNTKPPTLFAWLSAWPQRGLCIALVAVCSAVTWATLRFVDVRRYGALGRSIGGSMCWTAFAASASPVMRDLAIYFLPTLIASARLVSPAIRTQSQRILQWGTAVSTVFAVGIIATSAVCPWLYYYLPPSQVTRDPYHVTDTGMERTLAIVWLTVWWVWMLLAGFVMVGVPHGLLIALQRVLHSAAVGVAPAPSPPPIAGAAASSAPAAAAAADPRPRPVAASPPLALVPTEVTRPTVAPEPVAPAPVAPAAVAPAPVLVTAAATTAITIAPELAAALAPAPAAGVSIGPNCSISSAARSGSTITPRSLPAHAAAAGRGSTITGVRASGGAMRNVGGPAPAASAVASSSSAAPSTIADTIVRLRRARNVFVFMFVTAIASIAALAYSPFLRARTTYVIPLLAALQSIAGLGGFVLLAGGAGGKPSADADADAVADSDGSDRGSVRDRQRATAGPAAVATPRTAARAPASLTDALGADRPPPVPATR